MSTSWSPMLLRVLGVALAVAGPAAVPVWAMQEGPAGATTGDAAAPMQALASSPEGQQFTGAATTSVEIDVPAGRNGMQPNLALAYSSQSGQGQYGAGWDLPIGRIERSRRLGVPRYDGADVFVVLLPDGAAELVALPDGSFAARIDDGHSRTTANASANTWTLNDRSGRIYTFGATAAARVGPAPNAFASTFAWHLTQVRDANGNTVDVEWEQTGGGVAWVKAVRWGGAASGLPHRYQVTFAYGSRPGHAHRISYGAGFAQKLDRLLESIDVSRVDGQLVRRYDLVWRDSATNGLPLLSEVRLIGSDGSTPLRLESGQDASSRFVYHEKQVIGFAPARAEDLQMNFFRDETEVGGSDHLCATRDFMDLDGDGRPDLVRVGGQGSQSWSVRLNQGPTAPSLFAATAIAWPAPADCLVERFVDSDSVGRTRKAVLDMNGDGRPDFVSVAEPSSGQYELRVYLNDGTRFVTPYQVWGTGLPALREGRGTTGEVYRDLIDLNGDGRPEAVYSQAGTWRVRWNLGTSLAPAVDMPAPTAFLRNGGTDSGDRTIRTDLFDVNGDGLPDKVVAGNDAGGNFWNVWFGTGRGFTATPERWNGVPKPLIRAWNADEERFDYDVFDVTGDGLPDLVDAVTGAWRVYPGTGRGFLAMRVWAAPAGLRVRHDTEVFHALRTDAFDIDGDGFVDSVKLAGGNATIADVALAMSGTGATDTLSQVTSDQFASYNELRYALANRFNTPNVDPLLNDGRHHLPFPVWVLSSITTTDFSPGGTMSQSFRYDGGYFDPGRREFRGFQWAWRTDDYGTTEETWFHQAEPLQGRPRRTRTLARNPALTPTPGVLRAVSSTWQWLVVSGRYVVSVASRATTSYSSGADLPWNEAASRTVTSAFTYDGCGNLTRETVTDSGAPGVLLSDNSAAFHAFGGGCTSHRVCAGQCDRVQSTAEVNGLQKTYAYDSHGNPTSVTTTGPGNPLTAMTYDGYGNLLTVTDPRGAVTRFTYDGDLLRVASKVEDAGGANLTTTFTWDARFGTETSRTGPGCGATTTSYDLFGRVAWVAEPGQSAAQPTRRYAYHLGGRSHVVTEILELEPTPHYRKEVAFYDAHGRPQQTQAERLVHGQTRTVVTDGVLRQQGGRVVARFAPLVVTTAATSFAPIPETHPNTAFLNDEFGRVIWSVTPDMQLLVTSRAKLFVTRTCDARHGANPSQGMCREEEVDGLGRVIAERTYLGASTTPYTTRTLLYNAFGKVSLERQNGETRTDIVTTYDALGRRVQVADPDSGTWRYGYDAGGNLVYQDDPVAGQHVEIEYDGLGRPTRKRTFAADGQGQGAAAVVATWTYDTAVCGRGRLASAVDPSGSTTITAYDERGNALQGTKQITFEGVTKPFSSVATYDALGRPKSSRLPYPDADGREQVFYDYGWHGALMRIRSEHGAYLLNVKQDEFGRPTDIEYGNGVHDVSGYLGGPGAFRLYSLQTLKAGGPFLRDLHYEDYDENGQVRAVRDLVNFPGDPRSLTQVATYDDASRLTQAVQCGGGRYASAFGHDALGNLRSKDGVALDVGVDGPHQVSAAGGADLQYDASGNMIGLPGGRQLFYDAEGRLVRVERNGQEIARYLYDHSGRRVAARTPEGTTFFFGSFDWRAGTVVRHVTAGDRVIAVSPVADTNAFAALADPLAPVLLARIAGGTALVLVVALPLILPGRSRVRVGGRLPRSIVALLAVTVALAQLPFPRSAAAQCPDATVGPPPSGTLIYHVDHLGSPQLLTDHTGAVAERLVHRPYGALAGAYGPGGQALGESESPFLFTGHRADDGTGLIYMGARYYDIALGMFVSHDPAAQFFSPYTYGNGDPLNGSDPSGALFGIDDAIIIGIIIGAIVGAVVSGVQAALNGASAGQALKAAGIGAAIGAVSGAVFGFVGNAVYSAGSTTLSTAYNLALAGYATYGAVQSFDSGQHLAGALAILGAASALAQAASAITGQGRAGGGRERSLYPEEVAELRESSYPDTSESVLGRIVIDDGTAPLTGDYQTVGSRIHLGDIYSDGPLPRATERFSILVHEVAHVRQFNRPFGFVRTALGAARDFFFSTDRGYNPTLSSSSFSTEGQATIYEWAYLVSRVPGGGYGASLRSNFPVSPGGRQQLFDALFKVP